MDTYRNELIRFSETDKLIKSISNKTFKSPVYLCKYHPRYAIKYECIKNYILNHLVSVNEKMTFDLGENTIIPIAIKSFDSIISLVMISSDNDISIVIDKSEFDKLLDDISEITRVKI